RLDDLALGRAGLAGAASERLDTTRMVSLRVERHRQQELVLHFEIARRERVGRCGGQVVQKLGVVLLDAADRWRNLRHRSLSSRDRALSGAAHRALAASARGRPPRSVCLAARPARPGSVLYGLSNGWYGTSAAGGSSLPTNSTHLV